MTKDREQRIRAALLTRFAPTSLTIKDESHLHVGHAGAKDGKGHFEVIIVSEQFAGAAPLKRHRMVYDALSRFLDTDIHALRIKALTTEESSSGD